MTSERGLCGTDLTFAYGSHVAVKTVSLSVPPDSTIALTGPNGSGKTTLLRLLSGTLHPDEGKVSIDGIDVLESTPREIARRVAVVPQHMDPTLSLKVESMVALGRTPYASLLRPLSSDDRAAVQQAMKVTDTSALQGKRFSELSGGEQQRVALAMAMAQDTTYLLLDEPTVHLDLEHQHAFFELLATLRKVREMSVLAVMHDLNLAALYFDSMIVMESGRFHAHGDPSSLLASESVMHVFRAPVSIVSHPQMGVAQVLLRRRHPES